LEMSPQMLMLRNSHFLKVVGRIRRGRDAAAAQSDMSGVARQLSSEFPVTNERVGITVVSLKSQLLGESRTTFLILESAAGCVLLIACANIANLLLVRASAGRRDMAVRAALGASSMRLFRQTILENLLLAAGGGVLGLIMAAGSMVTLGKMVPPGIGADLRLDPRVVVFSAVVTIFSALLFGLAPAVKLSRARLSSRTVVGSGAALRHAVVAAEVAIALVLVIGAGLLIKTLIHLRAVDPGFRSDGILTAEINVAVTKDQGRNQQFYTGILAEVRSIPGVEAAGLTSDLPYTSRGNTMGITVEGRPCRAVSVKMCCSAWSAPGTSKRSERGSRQAGSWRIVTAQIRYRS
jgi:putative ABC transport system permease protein